MSLKWERVLRKKKKIGKKIKIFISYKKKAKKTNIKISVICNVCLPSINMVFVNYFSYVLPPPPSR